MAHNNTSTPPKPPSGSRYNARIFRLRPQDQDIKDFFDQHPEINQAEFIRTALRAQMTGAPETLARLEQKLDRVLELLNRGITLAQVEKEIVPRVERVDIDLGGMRDALAIKSSRRHKK